MAARKRHQTKAYLYEIRSEIRFDTIGRKKYKTFYGSDTPLNKSQLLARARENIKAKLDDSSGRMISLSLVAVYH